MGSKYTSQTFSNVFSIVSECKVEEETQTDQQPPANRSQSPEQPPADPDPTSDPDKQLETAAEPAPSAAAFEPSAAAFEPSAAAFEPSAAAFDPTPPQSPQTAVFSEPLLRRLESAYNAWELGNTQAADAVFQETLAFLYRNACAYQCEKKLDYLFEMARLLHNRGLIARKRSVYHSAHKNFSRVFFVYLKLAVDEPDVFLILTSLAQLDITENKNDYSGRLFGKVLEVYSKLLSADSWIVFATFVDLFLLHCRRGLWDLAAQFAEKAIACHRGGAGADDLHLLRLKIDLSLVYERLRKFDVSYRLRVETLETLEKKYGRCHPNVLAHLMNIAKMLETMGEYEKAESIYKVCEKNYHFTGGRNSVQATFAKSALATLYMATGKISESFCQLSQCLNSRQKAMGEMHPLVADTHLKISILEWAFGRFDKAEDSALQAFHIYSNSLGSGHELTMNALSTLRMIRKHEPVKLNRPF